MLPCILEETDLPLAAIFYSKYDTSGSVVSGYDKETVAVGFNSTVTVDSSGNMIIAWNAFDIYSLKVRIMALIYPAGESASKVPFEVGVRSDYAPSSYVDVGNRYLNTGIDVAADSEGNFFITWCGSNLINPHVYLKEIYGNEIQVSQGYGLNYNPSIATDSQGNIIITWKKCSSGIYARRYDNNLQALGDEFKVNVSY
jgi:hypothetical protein